MNSMASGITPFGAKEKRSVYLCADPKAYKEGEDWKYTNSFNIEDLPKVALVANEAYKNIRLKSTDSNE